MDISHLSNKMMRITGLTGVLCAMGSIAYYRSLQCLPFVVGVVLGTALSILKILMLRNAVDRAMIMNDSTQASNHVRLQYFIRLLLTALLLTAAALLPFISLWGAAAGILSFQVAAYGVGGAVKKQSAAAADDDR